MTPSELSDEIRGEIELNREALKDTKEIIRSSRVLRAQVKRRVRESDATATQAEAVLRKVGYLQNTTPGCA